MEQEPVIGWLLGVLLVSVRVAVPFIMAAPFASVRLPSMAKIILVFTLALALVGYSQILPAASMSLATLGSCMIYELIVGAAISTGLFAAFSAFQFAGRLLDYQVGFGVASLVDLATRNNAPLLGTLLYMLAILFFFAINGHLALLKVISLSLQSLPPGKGIMTLNFGALIAQFSTCFAFGLIIVAPIVLCLFLVDVGMAFMSRTMPQMNVFVISMSLKSMVCLVMLAIVIPFSGGIVQRIFDSLFSVWLKVFENG